MRLLPPPRITRKRRWRRIKRAIKSLFTRGRVSDPGAFVRQPRRVSKIKRSRMSKRVKRDRGLRETTSVGLRTAAWCGRMARPMSRSLLKINVKI